MENIKQGMITGLQTSETCIPVDLTFASCFKQKNAPVKKMSALTTFLDLIFVYFISSIRLGLLVYKNFYVRYCLLVYVNFILLAHEDTLSQLQMAML